MAQLLRIHTAHVEDLSLAPNTQLPIIPALEDPVPSSVF